MSKWASCITLSVLLWLVVSCDAVPANPNYVRDESLTSNTLGYSSDYFGNFNAGYKSTLSNVAVKAQNTHAALEMLTVSASESRIDWLAKNSIALAQIAANWPPTQQECRYMCGENVGDNEYGLYRTGTCQVHILEEHRKWFQELATEAAGFGGLQSLAWKKLWYGDPIASWPPYWTLTHQQNKPPVYMLNGYCTCRPGWGMSQQYEDSLWTQNSPFNGPVITEPSDWWYAGVYQTVNYTGQGRVIMSTLMTHDNFNEFADAESSNVVLGFKAPMACEIEVDRPLRPSSDPDVEYNTRHPDLKELTLIQWMGATCADVRETGHGFIDSHARDCFEMIWGDHPMSVDFVDGYSIDLIHLDAFPTTAPFFGADLQECLPYLGDLNHQGLCSCHLGYGDTDHVWENYEEQWLLERPYFPPDLLTISADKRVVNDTIYGSRCNGYDRFYCALTQPMTFPGLPHLDGVRLGSPRCDDYRQCNMLNVKDNQENHKTVPYRMKASHRGFLSGEADRNKLPDDWTPEDNIEILNSNNVLIYLSKKRIKPRTCHEYVCTSPTRVGQGPIHHDDGSLSCQCTGKWTGAWCEIDGNAEYCSGHGEYSTDTGLCECDDDWFHATPASANDTQCNVRCGELLCGGNGQCNQTSPSCVCGPYHTGSHCQDLCGAVYCNGHGNCTTPWIEGTSACFDCDAGFSGTHCHVNPRWEQCSGHGTPVDTSAPGYTLYEDGCICDEDYYGTDCSLYINPADSTCINYLGDTSVDETHNTEVRHSYGARRVLDHYHGFGQT